ncbi:MAG: NmrA family NAD(P)-binding protein [Bradyrhizobiaceae bacterium]|nr:NmrA family NAD(P)-binding protein [Bradyrhizobiaceae bacterium]
MIAVVGATGNIGRATVKELRALGEDPVCIVRNADKAREVLGADVRTTTADLNDRSAVERALSGVDRLFVVTGGTPQLGELEMNVLNAAKAAGVKWLVKLAGGKCVSQPDSGSLLGRGHYAVEEALKQSGLGWVILRPGLFMQNTLAQAPLIKSESKMALAFPKDLPLAFIDTRDVGALAARVVRDPAKHASQSIEFTGVITNYGQFAQVFSEVLGRPIAYVGLTLEQAEQGMKARGMPEWLVDHMLTIARLAAQGEFSIENMQPFRDIVGRAPASTKQFVQDHKAMFS